MKKTIYIFILSIILFASFSPVIAQQNDYTVLTPLPCTTTGDCTSNGTTANLSTYLPGLFKLAVGVGAALAFVFIFWYGFEYMFTDSFIGKGKAKERITEVLTGLALIIFSYLILYTINPKLLDINLLLEKPNPVSREVALSTDFGQGTTVGTGVSTNTNNCTNCTPVNQTGLSLSARTSSYCQNQATQGCFINQNLTTKLQDLNGKVSGLVLTEVFPPSVNHQDPCHYNGTCVDASFSGIATPSSIKTFIDTAKASGLRPVFETPSNNTTLIAELTRLGIRPPDVLFTLPLCSPPSLVRNCITGSHFSIYNQ